MKRPFSFLFLVAVVISSCEKEVSKNIDQSRIHTCYELFYDQNTDMTYASAVFRFSSGAGSTLELSDPSKVLFDGQPMTFNTANGHYETELSGVQLIGTFEWTDTEGKVYTNAAEIHEVDYGVLPDTLYKGDGNNQFVWSGDVIGQDETMTLTIDGTDASDTRVFSNDTLLQTFIVLDSGILAQVTSGNITLVFDRIYSPPLQEETQRGGKRLGRYRPTDRMLFLADSIQ